MDPLQVRRVNFFLVLPCHLENMNVQHKDVKKELKLSLFLAVIGGFVPIQSLKPGSKKTTENNNYLCANAFWSVQTLGPLLPPSRADPLGLF